METLEIQREVTTVVVESNGSLTITTTIIIDIVYP